MEHPWEIVHDLFKGTNILMPIVINLPLLEFCLMFSKFDIQA